MKKIYQKEANEGIRKGVNVLANIVGTTLGAKGKNVVIGHQFGGVSIVNDGATIAREIVLDNELLNLGATLAKQVADKTNDDSGDGTTTSVILLQTFLSEMTKVRTTDVRKIREDIRYEVDRVIAKLDEMKEDIVPQDIEKIAYISSLDWDIAKVVAEVIQKVGKDGIIEIENAREPGIFKEDLPGIRINSGYLVPHMITNQESRKAEIENAPVLCTRKKIATIGDILPLMNALMKAGKSKLAIFAEDVAEEVIGLFVVNKLQGKFVTLVVKTGEMEDIAIVTGAKIVTTENNYEYSQEILGEAGKVVSTRKHTTVIEGKEKPEEVEKRIAEYEKQIEDEDNDNARKKFKKRIADLKGGVAVIKIAGESEPETKEKRLKLEDAVNACKSALEDGIVEGGGLALMKVAKELYPPKRGIERLWRLAIYHLTRDEGIPEAQRLVMNVINSPMIKILMNADENVRNIFRKVFNDPEGRGYNVETRQLEKFFETGVIDPVKVTKSAVRNAFAMGNQIMTAEAAVIDTTPMPGNAIR